MIKTALNNNIKKTHKNKKKRMFYFKRDFQLYVLLLIPLTYFLVFKYLPMYGVIIAFKDYNIFDGVFKSNWIGFDVFREIFKMKDFFSAVKNTFMLNFLDLFLGFPIPIILAILINEIRSIKFKKVSQTILYFPHFISWVIIGGIATQLFSQTGLVNSFLKTSGLSTIPFLTNGPWWIVTYLFTGIWQGAGWGTILYLAAIIGINPELFEAAQIDGANRLKRIWYIILPGMKSTIVILLILNLGQITSIGFDRPYVLGNAFVHQYSDVISTFVYNIGLVNGRFNVATAVGLFQSLVGVVFLVGAQFIADKLGEQGIW
ncbi:ABC transporter permease [Clostridium sp.]|uniref:ABC transporter permease n=1 Tax=Clostridium sp. TaxID=1506 RepID=UPI003FD8CD77